MKTYIAPLLKSDRTGIETPNGNSICWLDEFLDGELKESANPDRPLVVLLFGPPGAGKSLLLQQICYHNAAQLIESGEDGDAAIAAATSLLISTETSPRVIIDNLDRLGFENALHPKIEKICLYDGFTEEGKQIDEARWNRARNQAWRPLMFIMDAPAAMPSNGARALKSLTANIEDAWRKVRKTALDIPRSPNIVAIDSLNILSTFPDKQKLFDSLVSLFQTHRRAGPKYLFLVLDALSTTANGDHAYWEYVADISIRVGYRYQNDEYFMRELEIVKTRPQYHSLGKCLAKIYSAPGAPPEPSPQRNFGQAQEDVVQEDTKQEGARPTLQRGGLFVFPSLHYVLSKVRTGRQLVATAQNRPPLQWAAVAAPGNPSASGPGQIAPPLQDVRAGFIDWQKDKLATLNWPVNWCYELVGGGIPLNHCTALIGRRGARKSYFGYQFILDGVVNGEETLIISLRDDELGIYQTLDRISNYYGAAIRGRPYPKIIYQRPGYVSPEELVHRVIAHVGEFAPTRVLVNAVDQWEAAYPLLHGSAIFLPTLIDFLNSHGATSMIVGVQGESRALGKYGLTAEAEVVLSFNFQGVPWESNMATRVFRPSSGFVDDAIQNGIPLLTPPPPTPPGSERRQPKVIVRAERVPRGAAGFGRAVLQYLTAPPPANAIAPANTIAGLEMIPLAPEYPEGDPL
jgi:KaiC/GvpD/RAD55 family RecA-like ATPase